MKKVLLIMVVLTLFPFMVRAEWNDSTGVQLANSIYETLNRDTTGTASLPRYLVVEYAREGVDKIGWDVGIEAGKQLITSAYDDALLVDTNLLRVSMLVYDSASYPRRALKPLSPDSLFKLQFSKTITNLKNATNYAVWGDSVLITPVSSDVDTFRIRYWKQIDHLSDSTTATSLSTGYRNMAIMWGCYKSSERVNNGRADEFLARYDKQLTEIWRARGVRQ